MGAAGISSGGATQTHGVIEGRDTPAESFILREFAKEFSMHIVVAFFVCIGLVIVVSTLFIDNN